MASDPKSLVEFIIDAIDEVAPGRGADTYRRGFDMWCEYSAQRAKKIAKRDLLKAAPLLAK